MVEKYICCDVSGCLRTSGTFQSILVLIVQGPKKLHLCGRNYQNVGKYGGFAQTEIGRFRRAGWQHCILQKAKQIRWLSAFVEVNW